MARSILRGDAELRRALRGIPDLTAAGLDRAVRESLEPMREQTRRNALRLRQPGQTPPGGHLDQGVVIRKVDGRGKTYRKHWVSFTRRARFIAHLLEFGVAPHIQPIRLRGGMHPGHSARPFFTPAYEGTKDETVKSLGQKTWALISGAASRFGRVRSR